MSDITLKDIGSLLDKKLKPLETKVSGIETKVSGMETKIGNIETKVTGIETRVTGIETKVNNLDGKADRTSVLVANLVEDFHDVPATLKSIVQTLNSHTAVLEQLLIQKKAKDEEKTVSADRFDRLEQWAVLAGKKLGIRLEL